jgi:hypothetical protein
VSVSELPVTRRVSWQRAYRIIAARYPPIAIFEDIADPQDWEALVEIESLTNERVRDEIGDISLVPPADRISGPGASFVMAAFTHVGVPSRFSDGTWGVYYAGRSRTCAVAETTYHYARFYAATDEPACEIDVRVLVGAAKGTLHDLRGEAARYRGVYDPASYAASQALARELRELGSSGLVYDSVRCASGQCLAAFRPRVLAPPRVEAHLLYHFDGARIARYFDYAAGDWITL